MFPHEILEPMRSAGKKFLPGVLISLAFLGAISAMFPCSARGYYQNPQDEAFIIKTEVRDWYTYGSIKYRIATQISPPGAKKVLLGDTLDYRNMDSALPLFSAEVRPLKGVAVDFQIGDSRFSNGKVYIHNWLDGPRSVLIFYNETVWTSPDYRDYAKTRAKINGTTRLYSADAYFRVYKTAARALRDKYDLQHTLELFTGYSWYEDRIRITDGYTLLSVDIFDPDIFGPPPSIGPIAGLNSVYNMTWQGWRAGFREQTRLSSIWTINAKFAFGPTMSYRGQGFWNLGAYYSDSFSFRHTVTGQVLELSAFAEWSFWKRFQLKAGYLGWFYRITSGTQKTYYANGTQSEAQIMDLNAARKGFFLALSWKF
ncbi:MAG: hypothetical protein KKH28_03085 [Elusimicrobia bacterium]|nr:hypothetical protein [Elusimicrobiota bacterium]